MSKKRMKYSADFETTTDENDCRVWAVGISSIYNYQFEYGNNIDWLFDYFENHPNTDYYFHNQKFDGEFILHWLLTHGFKWHADKNHLTDKTFSTLISDVGQFYSIEICLSEDDLTEDRNIIKIYDSLKILPMSVKSIAKAFDLPIEKGEIDYKAFRPKGHKLTDDEISYLRNDCEIVARALNFMFSQGLTKMTTASNALFSFKKMYTVKQFKRDFPILPIETDTDIRRAYRGGFTYVNPLFQNREIGEGIVLDVNSLYPSRMMYENLPYGEPIFFEGEYENDEFYPLYVQKFVCEFEIKSGYIPTIQLKNSISYNPTEYITKSDGDVEMILTNVDLALFLDHYNVANLHYISGWKFKSANGFFTDYINYWNNIKIKATKEGNKGLRTIAKLMLNSLYGKFGLNPKVCSKIPYLMDGVVKYRNGDEEIREPIYIPMAVFITAYARNVTIRAAQQLYDRFMYADTDSLHLRGLDMPDIIEIDDVKLGAWKHESTFLRAKYLRAKTYIEEIKLKPEIIETENSEKQAIFYDSMIDVKCAGMPDNVKKSVTWENFNCGSVYAGKLIPKHVKGGIVLVDTEFTIKK